MTRLLRDLIVLVCFISVALLGVRGISRFLEMLQQDPFRHFDPETVSSVFKRAGLFLVGIVLLTLAIAGLLQKKLASRWRRSIIYGISAAAISFNLPIHVPAEHAVVEEEGKVVRGPAWVSPTSTRHIHFLPLSTYDFSLYNGRIRISVSSTDQDISHMIYIGGSTAFVGHAEVGQWLYKLKEAPLDDFHREKLSYWLSSRGVKLHSFEYKPYR